MLSFHLKCQLLFNYFIVQTVRKMRQQTMLKKCKRCGALAKKKGWSVRFRVQASGQNVHKRLSGFKTKKDANRAYIEYLHNLSATAKNSGCFEHLLESYFQNCRLENAESTVYEKRHIFSRYITPFFAGKNLSLLSKSDYIAWQTHWRPRKTGDRNL